jgi:hypothetical protein
MARRRARSYFEPWVARPVKGRARPFGGVKPELLPQEAFDHLTAGWERSREDADWIVWGSRMADPATVVSLEGKVGVMDDRRIIAVSHNGGLPEGSPHHGEIASRIAACVNACAGIAEPETFVAGVRALLLALVNGEADRGDPRVLPLLARCIPPDELDAFEAGNYGPDILPGPVEVIEE